MRILIISEEKGTESRVEGMGNATNEEISKVIVEIEKLKLELLEEIRYDLVIRADSKNELEDDF